MSRLKTTTIALYYSLAAVLIGLITFTLNWNLYDLIGGPLPGYKILLFPGNLSLIYVWHPIFTEEVALLPKLGMILLGQFILVYVAVVSIVGIVRKINS